MQININIKVSSLWRTFTDMYCMCFTLRILVCMLQIFNERRDLISHWVCGKFSISVRASKILHLEMRNYSKFEQKNIKSILRRILVVITKLLYFSLTCGRTRRGSDSLPRSSISVSVLSTNSYRTGSRITSPYSTLISLPCSQSSCPCTSFPFWTPSLSVAVPKFLGTGNFCPNRWFSI